MYQLYSGKPIIPHTSPYTNQQLDAAAIKAFKSIEKQTEATKLLVRHLASDTVYAEIKRLLNLISSNAELGNNVDKQELHLFEKLAARARAEQIDQVFSDLARVLKLSQATKHTAPENVLKNHQRNSVMNSLSIIGGACPEPQKSNFIANTSAFLARNPNYDMARPSEKALLTLAGKSCEVLDSQHKRDDEACARYANQYPVLFSDSTPDFYRETLYFLKMYCYGGVAEYVLTIRAPSMTDDMKDAFINGLRESVKHPGKESEDVSAALLIGMPFIAPYLNAKQCQSLVDPLNNRLNTLGKEALINALNIYRGFKHPVEGLRIRTFIYGVENQLGACKEKFHKGERQVLLLLLAALAPKGVPGDAAAIFNLYLKKTVLDKFIMNDSPEKFIQFCHLLLPHMSSDERTKVMKELAQDPRNTFESEIFHYMVLRCQIPVPVLQANVQAQAQRAAIRQ